MPNISVLFHYERAKVAPSNATDNQLVHRDETRRAVVNATATVDTLSDGSKETTYSEANIKSALNSAGFGATGNGGMSLKIESYASA